MNISLSVILAAGLLSIAPLSRATIQDPVRVEQGQLSGLAGKSAEVRVYRGIPYAAPPVGNLRWKAPQPAASWKGVRAATEFGDACWQTPYPPAFSIYESALPPLSEDCLYLNVWTSAKSAADALPVMVWIHGGGFTRGAGSIAGYDGENLARKGVVVVTINYRLGVFGFFAHPELTAESPHHASGNYALMDQIAALQWVKKNIAAFGGDPARVTIFGESAGSWAVNLLVASPLAKGLFQRAIGESGASMSAMTSLADAEKSGEKLASTLGAAQGGLKALRGVSAEALLKVGAAETVRAIVDGWVLPKDVHTIFAEGKQNDVTTIVGNNSDEGRTLAPQGASMNAALFTAQTEQRFGKLAGVFLAAYPAGSDPEAIQSFYALFRDDIFGWDMRTWARVQTRTGHHRVYRYYFSHHPPGPEGERLGAFHAAEIAYVFGTFAWPFPWNDADKRLSETMMSYWTNFAKTGDPNAGNLPKWPVYNPESDNVLEFGDSISVQTNVNGRGLDAFEDYHQSLAAAQGSR
ncbi:MAG TPA: carboxylesterase/lipase family protein [Candidatus Acidoferrales bacterium]|nr:carboxylesterase/lipase family protein [Candidatus Acidoferrales bacterium]